MAAKYPELDIYPKGSMDCRDVQAPEWVANLWQPSGVNYLEVRPGFGQRAQFDSSTSKPFLADPSGTTWTVSANGYKSHLGSYLYNSLYNHRQILSVFEAELTMTDTADPTEVGVGIIASSAQAYTMAQTLHGYRNGIVFSIYDLTSGQHYEEIFLVHTSQSTRTNEMIPAAHGHYESHKTGTLYGSGLGTGSTADYRAVHSGSRLAPVSFEQIMDSVVISSPDIGVWQYFGIDPVKANTAKIRAAAPDAQMGIYFGTATVADNVDFFSSGHAESSFLVPVVGIRGLAEQFAYFDDSEFPKINASAVLGNVMCYAADSAIFFADAGHAGSIMGGNFVVANFDTPIVALEAFNGNLYAFTTNETWLITVNYGSVNADEPSKIIASAVRLSRSIGCVGPRSVTQTPIGLCWVSSSGVHVLGGKQSIVTISDPIFRYWKEGVEDPVTNFHINSTPGSANQPSAVYRHSGNPTLAFNKSDDALLIAYPDHIWSFNTVTKMWCIWPLKSLQKLDYSAGTQVVEEYQPVNCHNILADADGTYIVGGMQDPNQTTDATYTAFGRSYYVLELGRGGALDRSAKRSEDNRKFGSYDMRAMFADPANLGNNATDFVVHVAPPLTYKTDTEAFIEFPVRFTSLSRLSAPHNKATNEGVEIPLYYPSDWTVDRFVIDASLNENPGVGGGGAANVTVTTTGAPTHRVTVKFNDRSGVAGSPFVRSSYGRTVSVGRLILKKTLPLATTDLFRSLLVGSVLGVINECKVTLDPAGTQKPPLAWTSTQMHPDAFLQQENQEAGTVQYAYKSGMVGIDQEKNIRARGIFAVLESAGEADIDRTVKPVFGLYNTIMAGDRRLMSAQYRDYVGQDGGHAKGEVMISKAATIRKRLNAGKRTFGGGAKYRNSGSSSIEDAYLIDSPERNVIATSASARGASLAAMIFGFMSDKAQRLKVHKLFMSVIAWGAGRRRGEH